MKIYFYLPAALFSMFLFSNALAAPICNSLYVVHPKAQYHRPWGGLIAIHKKKQLLTTEDREEIQDVFNDKEKSLNYKMMLAFQIYNKARLKIYDPSERADVQKTLDSLPVRFNDESAIAHSELVEVPRPMINTAIMMGILAHEREHRAQIYRYSGAFTEPKLNLKNQILLLFQTYGVRTKYLMEKDAMRAEWEILNSLPQEAIDHSLAIIEKTQMPPEFRNLMLVMLKNSKLSQDDYIKAQHKSGRYSHKQNFIESSKNALVLIINLLFLSAPVYLLI